MCACANQNRIDELKRDVADLEEALGSLLEETHRLLPNSALAYYAAVFGGLRTNPDTGLLE